MLSELCSDSDPPRTSVAIPTDTMKFRSTLLFLTAAVFACVAAETDGEFLIPLHALLYMVEKVTLALLIFYISSLYVSVVR